MFDFQQFYLTQEHFEKVLTILPMYKQVYATTKFDIGKTKFQLNLPMIKDALLQSTNTLKRKNSETTRSLEEV